MTTSERSSRQRHAALARANAVRVGRGQLKRDIAAGVRDADAALVSGDPLVASMRVEELILAVPGLGKHGVRKLRRHYGISSSLKVEHLSDRQRAALLVALRPYRAGARRPRRTVA